MRYFFFEANALFVLIIMGNGAQLSGSVEIKLTRGNLIIQEFIEVGP
jgi:hypothetical protein